jgi:nucleoside 2-deoxyribosyltransferase
MTLTFPPGFPESVAFPPTTTLEPIRQPRVYLAGPFFTLGQNWLIEQALEALEGQGFAVFSPLHHVGRGSARDVYGPDIKGVRESDIVFACVDGLDTGTIYEIGFAHSLGKPVVAFVENETRGDLTMLVGGGAIIESDFATAVYKTYWMASS